MQFKYVWFYVYEGALIELRVKDSFNCWGRWQEPDTAYTEQDAFTALEKFLSVYEHMKYHDFVLKKVFFYE